MSVLKHCQNYNIFGDRKMKEEGGGGKRGKTEIKRWFIAKQL